MSMNNTDEGRYGYRHYPPQVEHSFDPAEDRTKQEMKDECDINLIIPKAESTGIINHQSKTPPTYGDFSNNIEYQAALNQLIAADEAFQELPAKIRSRMNNDPGLLLDFLGDPNNREEAEMLGLLAKQKGGTPPTSPSQPAPIEDAESVPPVSGGE